MSKALLTFIGNQDCKLNEGIKGPIISILEKESYNKLYLFYSDDKYLKPASEILLYCRQHFPNLDVKYKPVIVRNPTDYNTVYPAMYSANQKLAKEMDNNDCTISLTSGTPTMHTCWIFLVKGGVLSARMIQVSREGFIDEVCLDLDDFPQIKKIECIKAELTKYARENRSYKENLGLEYDNIIGNCIAIQEIKKRIKILEKYDIPVFISGESGTGKELIAEAIHYNSYRKEKPFVKINCGAISNELFESEFFGHKKGSFTGAYCDSEGKLVEADDGTVFLDEIADLPLKMQVKLFRVLEEGTIQPVGGKEKHVNVRLITATNKDIVTLVKNNEFREELMYRIIKHKIELPPLRQRNKDIPLLIDYSLKKLNKKHKENKIISESAIKLLMKYSWPGNIRELFSVIENAFIFPGEIIDNSKIDFNKISNSINVIIPEDNFDFDKEVPKAYYTEALSRTNGNRASAARLLGLKEHTFRARLKKLDLE